VRVSSTTILVSTLEARPRWSTTELDTTDDGLRYDDVDDMVLARQRNGYRCDREFVEQLISGKIAGSRRWDALLTLEEAAERDFEESGFDGDIDRVHEYTKLHPDSWAGGYYEDDPVPRYVACFARGHEPHEAALRPSLRHPERIRFRTVRYSEQELEAAKARVTEIMRGVDLVAAWRKGVSRGEGAQELLPSAMWGADAEENAVVVWLPTGNEEAAVRLRAELGDRVVVVLRDKFLRLL
jgi:hypothetical protein